MSAIRLANTDPDDIPTPPADRTYVFLDLAGVLSVKDETGVVRAVVPNPATEPLDMGEFSILNGLGVGDGLTGLIHRMDGIPRAVIGRSGDMPSIVGRDAYGTPRAVINVEYPGTGGGIAIVLNNDVLNFDPAMLQELFVTPDGIHIGDQSAPLIAQGDFDPSARVAASAMQGFQIAGSPTGGSYVLHRTDNDTMSASLAHDADVAAFNAALAELYPGPEAVASGSSPESGVDIVFSGSLADQPMPILRTVDSFTGGTNPRCINTHQVVGHGDGLVAPAGSMYLRTTGEAWLKTSSGDTAWQQLAFVP